MRQPQPLHVGDRVHTIAPSVELPVGVEGVVRAIFPLGDFYDVYFSQGIGLRIVLHTKLERLSLPDTTAARSS
jgi:hypothetical protein